MILSKLLTSMTAEIKATRFQATFTRTPLQATIEDVIDYSTVTGIKLWQDAKQSLPIKFNVKGV